MAEDANDEAPALDVPEANVQYKLPNLRKSMFCIFKVASVNIPKH